MCRASAPTALLRIERRGDAEGAALSVQPLPHSVPGAAPDGAFLRSLSRPNHATGWFDPATPLPDAEVSFLTGELTLPTAKARGFSVR